ncbi:hypothetical protein BDB01DRAFT_841917 [Pilobolus umbonatus]|nr:hypothetical protein BDB01DRAFT_841917 [Pilobolus umbonatus]
MSFLIRQSSIHIRKIPVFTHSIHSSASLCQERNKEYELRVGYAYISIAKMVMWSTSLYFSEMNVAITKMRVIPDNEPDIDIDDRMLMTAVHPYSSIKDAENDTKERGVVKRLEVRWKLEGKKTKLLQLSEEIRHMEGVFMYRFDSQGYISEHRIQRLVPPPSRNIILLHSLGVRLRTLWETGKRTPALTPGF